MLSAPKKLALAILVGAALAVASGCASRQKIDASSSESVIQGVNKGDNVRITTKNGVTHKFIVTRITNKALYGESERVTYEDMQSVEVQGKDGFMKRTLGNIF